MKRRRRVSRLSWNSGRQFIQVGKRLLRLVDMLGSGILHVLVERPLPARGQDVILEELLFLGRTVGGVGSDAETRAVVVYLRRRGHVDETAVE